MPTYYPLHIGCFYACPYSIGSISVRSPSCPSNCPDFVLSEEHLNYFAMPPLSCRDKWCRAPDVCLGGKPQEVSNIAQSWARSPRRSPPPSPTWPWPSCCRQPPYSRRPTGRSRPTLGGPRTSCGLPPRLTDSRTAEAHEQTQWLR